MSAGLIGKKVGMTRVFTEDGMQVPVTVIAVGPCTVVGKRTQETDEYTALRVGFGEKKESRSNKPEQGESKKSGQKIPTAIREFRVDAAELAKYEIGQTIKADFFQKGQAVDVSGVTKGRGFQGVFKRHKMHGAARDSASSHEHHRHPGAIGQRKTPGRVFRNKRLPGHMGTLNVTTQNLKIIDVDAENNLLLIHGAIPGHAQGMVVVRPSVKAKKSKAEKK